MSSISVSRRVLYLLDTNVISETRKPRANSRVMQFIASAGSQNIFVSALTFGELRRGLVQLQNRKPDEAARLSVWIDDLWLMFRSRTISIDTQVAEQWGVLSSDRSRPPIDTLIAATAMVHGLTLVTRNIQDFNDLPVSLFNPWQAK